MDGVEVEVQGRLTFTHRNRECHINCDLCGCIIPLAIFIWVGLSFRLHGPRFYIQELYVPGLDLSFSNSSTNPSIFSDLSLMRVMNDHSVRYGDINLTFSYGQKSVANYSVPTFYQGKGKTAHRREVVEARGVPWEEAIGAVSNGSKAVFRVDLAARPKFRFWFWYSKKKGIRIGADVEVDGSGLKVQEGDIMLNFAAPRRKVGLSVVILCTLVNYILIFP